MGWMMTPRRKKNQPDQNERQSSELVRAAAGIHRRTACETGRGAVGAKQGLVPACLVRMSRAGNL
jgi:hypothetical protein